MKKLLGIVVLGLLFCNIGLAETIEEKQEKYAFKNMSYEYLKCQAYFWYESEAIKTNDPSSKLIDQYISIASSAGEIGYVYGKEAGMSDNALTARSKLEIKLMGNKIDNNFSNISILTYEYGDFCKDIMIIQSERIEYWNYKSKKKYQ